MDHEKFIEDVRKHPELYNKQHKHYMLGSKKEQIWQMLSKKHNIKDGKKKWTALREKYLRERKKIKPLSGMGNYTHHRPSELYNILSFLDEHVKPRSKIEDSSSSYSNDYEEMEEDCLQIPLREPDETDNTIIYLPDDIENNVSRASTPQLQYPKKRRTDDDVQMAFLESINVFNDSLNKNKNDEDQEDMHFLQSIGFKMKKMNENEKDKFKILMLQKSVEAVKKTGLEERFS